MRVLHVTQRAERLGGAELHLESLRQGLAERGIVQGLFAGTREAASEGPEHCFVPVPEWNPGGLVRDPLLFERLISFARSFRPDLVHLHQTSSWPAEIYAAVGELGRPIVQSVYDGSLLCPNAWLVRGDGSPCGGGPGAICFQHRCERHRNYDAAVVAAARLRLELMRRAADAYVCGSEALAALLEGQGLTNVRRLPYFPPESQRLQGFEPLPAAEREPGLLVAAARLEPEKGLDVAIDALVSLAPEVRLEIFGGGSQAESLAQQARGLGVTERVRLMGQRPLGELSARIARAQALVIPSRWMEVMPLVALEALAAGTPIVASAAGGIGFAVVEGETGRLVPPGEGAALAEALCDVLAGGDPWERLARGARERLAVFDRSAHLDAIEALYGELVAAGSGAGVTPAPSNGAGEAWGPEVRELLHRLVAACAAHEAKHLDVMEDAARERRWVRENVGHLAKSRAMRWWAKFRRGMDLDRLWRDLE